jgi:capsular polysaccharide biosynthesis protein
MIQATELIVPSVAFIPLKEERRGLPVWLKEFLHVAFLKIDTTQELYPSKIYISRSNASIRRIINEEEIIEILKSYGFVILHLEDLDPSRQAHLFYHANIIVAPHGSGLANLIFAQAGTQVIEIDHQLASEDQRSFFAGLTKTMNGIYKPFYVDIVEEDNLDEDMIIDIPLFKNFLRKIFNLSGV